jgi:hypothetical protein
MGIDTRFWGPSGWDLFHRIAFHSKNPDKVLANIAEVLPCKFCRNSTRRFVKELPYNKNDPGKWLYDIHNKVNHKLRTQCSKDPKVINPGPDPSFEEVTKRFKYKSINELFGEEFLLSVAVNFTPTPRRTEIQKRFLHNLAEAYPYFKTFYDTHKPNFQNYAEWMNGFTNISISRVKGYESKCKHGKTCRKSQGGGKRISRRYTRKGLKKTAQTQQLANEVL